MSEIKKILLQDEFEYYHSILSSHGIDLLNNFRGTLLGVSYDENTRTLKFGQGTSDNLMITDDGNGNIVLVFSKLTTIDDGEGNVSTTGITVTDDGKGNVFVS